MNEGDDDTSTEEIKEAADALRDIMAGAGFAARMAVQHGLPLDDLQDIMRAQYESAERLVGKSPG